jgi:hypothetical protein
VILTSEDEALLHSLVDEIQLVYGIKIGYSCSYGSFVTDNDVFVIYADDTTSWLLSREDFSHENLGIMCQDQINEFCLHDEQCQEFLDKLKADIEAGKIRPFPSMCKDFGHVKITVTRGPGWYDVVEDHGYKKTSGRRTLEQLRDRSDAGAVSKVEKSDLSPEFKEALIKSIMEDAESSVQVLAIIQELDQLVVNNMIEVLQNGL